MWSKHKRNKGSCRPGKKRSLLSNWELKDHTSLLSTNMARGFRNKIKAVKCVFSKISMDNVGNGQERFTIVFVC
jgi:hypothetical protein